MAKGNIELRGVRVNNLHIERLTIPRGDLIVLTGLSGSGKSSLAFETLYAEGQRRYVQSLSAYARQFLGRLLKPDVDSITGIPPAIVIEQRVSNRNPRSTVGTASEVYEYLRLLFARVGKIVSPKSGQEVTCHTVDDVVRYVREHAGARVMVLAPLEGGSRSVPIDRLESLAEEGYSRVEVEGQMLQIDSDGDRLAVAAIARGVFLMVDRFVAEDEAGLLMRCADSAESAFRQGDGVCRLVVISPEGAREELDFSVRLEADGIVFQRPLPNLFSFNNAMGACPTCEGYGMAMGIDEDLVIPDRSRSVYDDAVVCWRGPSMQRNRDVFIEASAKYNFPIHRPYYKLSEEDKHLLWYGAPGVEGIHEFFEAVARQSFKVQNRILVSRYSGRTTCPDCHGKRLRPEALWVQVGGKSIADLVELPLVRLNEFLQGLSLNAHDMVVARRLMLELRTRVQTLLDVGLGYLTLNRRANTLSGGETQRINLATSLGSSLVGSLYILDEPSVGLHPADTENLVRVLERLRDKGNTVLVVEHDEDVMRAADTLIDMGPGAGRHGGEILYVGKIGGIGDCSASLTGAYLTGKEAIPLPATRRSPLGKLTIEGVFVNNLRGVDVEIPLGMLTVITGVSGSGKSSLVNLAVAPAMEEHIQGYEAASKCYGTTALRGMQFVKVEHMDQNPLSRSTRSTPITYTKAFDGVRAIFAHEPLAKTLGMEAHHFSFNTYGGRCEACEGAGTVTVEMQFMADIETPCEECHGTRYEARTLEVKHLGKSIHDVLAMTVDEALDFFSHSPAKEAPGVVRDLTILHDVGLGYVQLGQPTSTLSGGEAQRLKLATYLLAPVGSLGNVFFIFDEPTTGLHIHDIRKLMVAFDRLIELGHTVLVIEHNVEVMRQADWIVDMGPGAGEHGGTIVCEGTPEQVAACPQSITARFLKAHL